VTILLSDLRVPLEHEGQSPEQLAARHLRLDVEQARILRKSLDARAGREPVFIYTLEVQLRPEDEQRVLSRRARAGRVVRPAPRPAPGPPGAAPGPPGDAPGDAPGGRRPLPGRPVIVGSGPAGLFAAWQLLRDGFRPLLLERGPDVTTRGRRWNAFLKGGAFDPSANLLFGEGGAGTFSDGKLTTRIKDERVATVLSVLVAHGAPQSCLWLAKPHVGSNALPAIVRRLRQALVAAGAEVRFEVRVDELLLAEGRVVGVRCGEERIACGALLLAIGHSATDTLQMLFRQGLAMSGKPFQMGLRVEHSQALIDRAQYGAACGHPALPVAEYALVAHDRAGVLPDVHSFCMCPGGEILPATERPGLLCVNGASPRARDGRFANSGLVVTVQPGAFGHDPRAGLKLREQIEARAYLAGGGDFGAPGQRVVDFLAGRPSSSLAPTSYPLPVRPARLDELLPAGAYPALVAALRDFDRRIPGYAGPEAMLVGPESRSSAPWRMERDAETHESPSHPGLLPIGEGAGWAGGIMSAAVDGLRAAEAIARGYAPSGAGRGAGVRPWEKGQGWALARSGI